MNPRAKYSVILAAGMGVIGAAVFCGTAGAYPKVTNVSPNPGGTNEFWLTATNVTVSIGGTNVGAMVYMDDPPGGGGTPPALPAPLVQVNAGTMVICHFQNHLTNNIEGASIHWHGIELDNDSDGTAISQDSVMSGEGYVYRFIPPRPGLYWYHSHMLPGSTMFGGMYGPIIVTDTNAETALVASHVLPSTNYTFPLLLSDISFTNGVVGKVLNGTNYSLNTLIQMCENYGLGLSQASQVACAPAGYPGNVVLVNGAPPALAGTVCVPATNSTPVYTVGNNQRVRLQLFVESISRDFYLSLRYACSNGSTGDTNLYRIGGQGGLLDHAIVEGGVQGGFNFLYNRGSVVLGSGMRGDVMFYPSGSNGDVVELVGNPLPNPWNLSLALPTNYPIAFFVITNTGTADAPLSNGCPILAGTAFTNASLASLATNALSAPPSPATGTRNGTVAFRNSLPSNAATNLYTPFPGSATIGGYAAIALDGNTGGGSWLEVPHPPTALWARVGDVLQLAIVNETGVGNAIHPYHLHGFSMQPLYIASANLLTNLYTYPYTEFLDTIEIYPNTALVFRIQLTDRPKFADTGIDGPVTVGTDGATGGAVGRWLMHCHIFLHATIGMISELDVMAPPTLINPESLGGGVFQFSFTNNVPGETFTVLATTNLLVPLTNWDVIDTATNVSPGLMRFTDPVSPGTARFYGVRSP